ncbi:carboxypeptidase-like regulatory domain-containing protein [Mucilaginibacter ginsenosidivorans]|uniref:Carboxypeptidase-like regulatory domain-containing protein n=1 Tax=Mucilaginibacter ginsenosidivorans TaxID=398053 RepID=A0A5B8V1Y6_9SPHI|nr:carboxypeptidase-like regulatory domain-containing protein [Mucilaginibacter ginsenosidivorans]QEC65065.1 carboxypeptidase-like regulatory domain-containing protein [Mucilaginibacter ginsenosidivorans]
MRWLTVLLIFFYAGANAQTINGRVLADSTGKPLTATIITHSGNHVSSNNYGDFSITVSGIGDTVKVSAIGYKTYLYPIKNLKQTNIIVRLKQVSILLNEVAVKAERNHKKDSITLRKDYAAIFNYQPKKVTDAFVPPPSDVPFTFVSINLLTLLSAVTHKHDPSYKLKKELLLDEEADYVHTRFNRSLVTKVTRLQGDSVSLFMDKYYPKAEWVRRTSDYDLIRYIKAKLLEFRKKD